MIRIVIQFLNSYHCYWLQGNTLKLYMKIFARFAVYKYINKKILGATVKELQYDLY